MDERAKLEEINDALKEMSELVKEKDRAYAENDLEAIQRIKEREAKLGAISLELGRIGHTQDRYRRRPA